MYSFYLGKYILLHLDDYVGVFIFYHDLNPVSVFSLFLHIDTRNFEKFGLWFIIKI